MSQELQAHAALMDSVYQRQRHFYDITRKWYLLGRDDLVAGLDELPDGARVLEAGCGTARNLRVAASRNPRLRYYGIDASSEMLDTAAKEIAAAKLGKQITVCRADILNFDPNNCFGLPGFDRILVSYTLSMVPQWQRALDQLMQCVAPGGSIEIVDFGMQQSHPVVIRILLKTWLSWFHVEPRAMLPEEFSHQCTAHGFIANQPRHLYGGYAIRLGGRRNPIAE